MREVGANDMVVISPETRHWHGASASESMAHLALSEALDGTSVTWMEHVDDESYARGAEAERTCAD